MLDSLSYNEGMKLIVQIKAEPEQPQALLDMITRFNLACNWLSAIAFKEHIFHWLPLQRRVYRELRERFNFTAAETLVAIRKVAYAYRYKARRSTLATFRPLGSIPLFKHVYYGDETVRLYGLRMPFHNHRPEPLPKYPKEGTLSYRDGQFYIHQVIEVEVPEPYQPQGFLGCDLGVVNILVDSEGQVYSGGKVNGLRKRHARLRARLQSIGTRSARRLLRKRRRREGRFARDVNHVISKKVVAKAKTATWGIALEDLKGIRERTQVRKADRRQHHSWAFDQLRQFLTYKAALAGVALVLVDPHNTSRTCPECGHIDKANRVSQAEFRCQRCGFCHHADSVAARNIARRAVLGRASGDTPDAPPPEEMCKSLAEVT